VVCGSDTVSFYAVDPRHKDALLQNLKAFSRASPIDVLYRFIE